MTYKDVFGTKKPIIGMIHTNSSADISMLELAMEEIEIYLSNGVIPLIENYFGSEDDCRTVLEWMQHTHPDAIYGLNILGDDVASFEMATKYGAKFIQIDSVCGHLTPKEDKIYSQILQSYRKNTDVIVLGGVRFKYHPIKSGRSIREDLLLGMERCDAIVCTGLGTGQVTPFEKIKEFKSVVNDFPVIVGAGVTIDTVEETYHLADGAIIGSSFKYWNEAYNGVNPDYVRNIVSKLE